MSRARIDQPIAQQPQPQKRVVPVAHVRPQGGLADAGTDLKDVRAAGDVTVTGSLSVAGPTKMDSVTMAGTLGVDGNVLFDKDLDVNGKIATTDTTPSLSAADGALVVAGGVGIGDDLNVADTIECLSLTTLSGGTVEFQGGFQSNQNSTFLQNIDVSGKVFAQGDLEHTGGNAGFFGTTPTTQPGPVADATGAGDVVAQLNALLAAMRSLGLIDT